MDRLKTNSWLPAPPRSGNVMRKVVGVVALSVLQACTSTPGGLGSIVDTPQAIEGHWAVGDTSNVIEVTPCSNDSGALCGYLSAFEGDQNARDFLQPSWVLWGQKLCESVLIDDLTYSEETRLYTGSFYNPDEGQHYRLILLLKTTDQIQARIYLGADVGEAVSLGINSLTGNVGVFNTLSLLTRASIGKEHLGENIAWRRVEPSDHCTGA